MESSIRMWNPEEKLKENEWLLKVRSDGMGFMTKLTQKGALPVKFDSWNQNRYGYNPEKLPINVITEVPREGWKLTGRRYGESRNWARMQHPEGFGIEIYMDDLLDVLINNGSMKNGVLAGKYYWEDNRLKKG